MNQSGSKSRSHTGLCRRPTASGNRGHGHFLHLPLLQGRQRVVLAAGERGGGVELWKPVEEEGHGEKKKGPDQGRSEDGEAVFIQRLSPERGCRRGEKMWITVCFSSTREWPVIQSSQHHGIGSTKEADIAPPELCRGPLGGQEKDSRFAIQAFRSPLRGRCARGRAASHSQGAIA